MFEKIEEAIKELGELLFGKAEIEEITEELDEKAVWTTARINDLPDSCFLYVESGEKDEEGKTVPRSKRHFPYKDVGGQIDLPHLRNAIVRIPQSNAPGLNKDAIQARARRLLEQAQGKKGNIKVLKQADGLYRWVGWVSNHFRDNDNPPEIISGTAHKEFVEYADREGKYPELWLWHIPGSKVGKADMLDFADGFLIASGTFDDQGTAESLAGSEDALTMSHGFARLQKAKDLENVTTKYRMFETSITPEGVEANPWTRFTATMEEKMGLTESKKAFLLKYLPEERITEIENDTEALRKAAEEAGVDWKAFEEAETIEEPKIQVSEVIAGLVEPVTSAVIEHLELGKLSELVEGMKAASESLVSEIASLKVQVAELSKSEDEKVAEIITPKAVKAFSWMEKAASHSEETLLNKDDDKDQKLIESKPFMLSLSETLAKAVAKSAGGA